MRKAIGMLLEESKSGIYSITNTTNNKVYIGSSIDIPSRWEQHIYNLNHNDGINKHIQRSWDKYGSDNFNFKVEEYCEQNMLIVLEKYYIHKYGALDPKVGYNIIEPQPSKIGDYPTLKQLEKYGGEYPYNIEKYLEENKPFDIFYQEQELNKLFLTLCFVNSIKDKFMKESLMYDISFFKYMSGFKRNEMIKNFFIILKDIHIFDLEDFNLNRIYSFKKDLENLDFNHKDVMKDLKNIEIKDTKIPKKLLDLNDSKNTIKVRIVSFILYNNLTEKRNFITLFKNTGRKILEEYGFVYKIGINNHLKECMYIIDNWKELSNSEEFINIKFNREIIIDLIKNYKNGLFVCKRCGNTFSHYTNTTQENNRKYCKDCAKIVNNHGYAGERTKDNKKIIKCIDCGCDIEISLTSRSIRCPDCKKIYNRTRSREYARAHRNKINKAE